MRALTVPRQLGLVLCLFVACGDDDSDPNGRDAGRGDAGPDGGGGSECTERVEPSADDQTELQAALIDAQPGDTICLASGRYFLTGQLSLAVPRVTVRGEGDAVLDFSGQTSGANGIEIGADGDTLENVTIENPRGDGVRANQVDGVTLRAVRVEWTEGPDEENGGYGLYPVLSSNVLIEDCYVSGASDAGIYVGQSETIVIRDSEATNNVAGIEVENSTDADVYGNRVHGNTGGILIFNLPGLRVKDGKRAKIHDNVVEDNNLDNFAPEGNIVADVPAGTGLFILASDENEVHDNEIRDNQSVGVAVLSWYAAMRDADGEQDEEFDWFPERNYVHGNTFSGNGTMPTGNAELIAGLAGLDELPDMVWDGFVDPDKLDGGDGGAPGEDAGAALPVPPDALRNCFADNGDATFLNVDLEMFGARASMDVTPYECEQPSLPAVDL